MPKMIDLDSHEVSSPARRIVNRRAKAGSWYQIQNKKGKPTEAEVLLFDEIGYWGVTAKQFAKDLNAVDAETIHLRINSPGGSVFDGVAIYNALLKHKARVIVHVEGIAASIASIIAMAGDEIIMHRGANMMIHKPWSFAVGDSSAMRKEAEVLDKLEESLVDVYESRTGKDRDAIKAMLAAETWFNPKEAVAEGFADSIAEAAEEDEEVSDLMNRSFDLSFFQNAPSKSIETIRDLERALREDYGMSRADAKAIASRGYNARSTEEPRDEAPKADGDGSTEVKSALERLLLTLEV